jgi:hypothetical protein
MLDSRIFVVVAGVLFAAAFVCLFAFAGTMLAVVTFCPLIALSMIAMGEAIETECKRTKDMDV